MLLPEIELRRLDGTPENFADYSQKTLLIVNVASNCGFTPQYKDLQQLYLDFNDKGFEILAFPCNQFGAQEPGTGDEIKNFCKSNYNITFPMYSKIDVNAGRQIPKYC